MSAAAVAEEAGMADSVPQKCTIINKDLLDAMVKSLLKPASPGTHAAHLRPCVEQHLAKILPSIKTPDHPPYALMIRQAIANLKKAEGSNEEEISEFIKLKYKDLPWGHVNFLRHHLKKLKDEEIFEVSGNRFKLSPEVDDSTGKAKKSKKRRRRSGKEEGCGQPKVSKSDGSSKEKNSVAEEDQEQSGAAVLHFKESEMQKNQNEEQQKQVVTSGSRKESQLGLEVNEEVNQVHLDSEAHERTMEATTEEATPHMKDANGLVQQMLMKDANVTPTAEASASNHFVAVEEQVLLQGQENEVRENQIALGSCTASKQIAFGFPVNGEVNQVCGQECEKEEDVRHKEKEHLVAIEGENTGKEKSTAIIEGQKSLQIDGQKEEREQSREIDEQEELKSQQFAVVEELQQNGRISEVIDTLIQVEEEPRDMEEENGLSIEGQKEERQQIESIEEQKAGNCKQDANIEALQNQMEVDPIQAEEHLDQMKEDNSLAIEGEKEETTQIYEKQDVPTEKKGAAGVSEEQLDGEVDEVLAEVGEGPALEQQEQPMEMQGPAGVLEGQNVNKGAENLTVDQCDGSLQVAVTEEGKVKAVGLEKQQQEWQPEFNEQHLQLKEIGVEIVEWIEKIITPQKPPKVVVGNKRGGEACGRAANFISSPACSSLKQEQCLELLNRAAKMQGMVVELMKSFGTAELSRPKSHMVMLESNETGHSDEQLPNATVETALPLAEPREDVEISCSARLEGKEAKVSVEHRRCASETELPLNVDLPVIEEENADISSSAIPSQVEVASMLEEQPQQQEVVAVVLEPKQQIEQLLNSSTATTTTLQLEENHQEKQPKLHYVQPQVEAPQGPSELESEAPEVDSTVVVGEEATKTALLLNLNSSLDMSAFLPEQEALKNKEPSAESHVEISLQLKLPDLQPGTISSISAEPTLSLSQASQEQKQKPTDCVDGNQQLHQQKEEDPAQVLQQNPGPTISAERRLSLLLASQEQQQKPTNFVDGNQQLHQQKEERPAQVLQQNPGPTISAEPKLSLWLASKEQQQKPTDFVDGNQQLHQQKEESPAQVLEQNTEPSSWQQHLRSESQSVNPEKMLQPNLFQGSPKPAPPSTGGDVNAVIFGTPQKQQKQSEPILHGQQKQMLSPFSTPSQLPSMFDVGSLFRNSLFQQPEQALPISPMKPSYLSGGKLQPLSPIELKKLMEEPVMPGTSVGSKRKLRFQDSPFGSPSPMSSDKKVGEAVGESEQVPQKKRRGRPPKQQTTGDTPPPKRSRPKIRQTVPKKPSNGEEGLSSQSPAKRGPGRPPKGVTEKKPVITHKNPF